MNHWWVNHKQTHKAELQGGYIWSPKKNSNGNRNKSYENLTRTSPGDTVISFANAEIKAIGVVTAEYENARKPPEFGQAGDNWSDEGWLVWVHWFCFENTFRPKNHIEQLAPLLPGKHSPIQSSGNGNQGCYLAQISESLHQAVLSIAASSNNSILRQLELTLNQVLEANLINERKDIASTEKEQLIKARRGQGIFKSNLYDVESRCRITGISDNRFLIASHIKPWSMSDDREKLDGNNGLLLAPHVDKLFDQGWITFWADGSIHIANSEIAKILNSWNISINTNAGEFNANQLYYLEFHRENVFRGSLT